MNTPAESPAYQVTAGRDYNASRHGVYEYVIYDANTENIIARESYFKSKRSAINAALRKIQTLNR